MDFSSVISASSLAASLAARRPTTPSASSANSATSGVACSDDRSAGAKSSPSTSGGRGAGLSIEVSDSPSRSPYATGSAPLPGALTGESNTGALRRPCAGQSAKRVSLEGDIPEQISQATVSTNVSTQGSHSLPMDTEDSRERWVRAGLEAPGGAGPRVPPSPFSAGSSKGSSENDHQFLDAPNPADQDEHDRAVAAFLRENGFTSLSRRRSCVVGATYPLHCAASQGLVRMTDLLIKAGANPHQKNNWGQTAVKVAKRCNRKGSHDSVLQVLQQASAAPAA